MSSDAKKNVRERMCIGCRELKPQKSLLRIVRLNEKKLSQDDETLARVIVDESGKAAGRGAYICPNIECLQAAKKNKALVKSLRATIPDEVYDNLREIILQQSKSESQ